MNFFDIKIETQRLLLVPIELSYAEEKFRHMNSDVTKYMWPKPASSADDTKSGILSARKNMAKGNEVVLAILKKENDEFIGCAGLHGVDCRTPEFGIWTKKDSHGNGYGMEAIVALYEWSCENIGFDYILYPVDKRNIPSRKIPESLGGVITREYKSINQSGFALDEVEYHIYPKGENE